MKSGDDWSELTYIEAKAKCEESSWHLCTSFEFKSGSYCGKDTGPKVGSDQSQVWVGASNMDTESDEALWDNDCSASFTYNRWDC